LRQGVGAFLLVFGLVAGAFAHGGAGHMQHMEKVRAMLKTKLGKTYDQPVSAPTAAQLKQGQAVYQQRCALCHGVKGEGNGPVAASLPSKPANFTDKAHANFYSPRGRIYIIENGVPGTAMAGMKSVLKPDEVIAVYQYIHSLAVPHVEK
jgi:mono/diheme cytochrome c family protein